MATVPPPALDALSLAAIALDLNARAGHRLAGVRQPDPQTIVLGLRDGRRAQEVFCSIHPQAARIHLGAAHVAGERLGSFGLLLRSRLVDAHLARVRQPPFERILFLELDTLDGPHTLVAEIMGRYSNLILVRGGESGIVVGALKVVTEQMSRRSVTPGRPYRLPPADRPHPDALDASALVPLLAGERPLWRALAQGVLGLGPLLAHEAALRAGVDPDTPASQAVASAPAIADIVRALAGAFRATQFAPTLYLHDGRPAAFAAIPLRVYAALEAAPVETMSEAVRRYYESAPAAGSALEDRRRALAAAVTAALRQTERALAANRAALAESADAERFRTFGELLLTYGREARRGATSVRVPDHTAAGAAVDIPLDPALGPVDNAQRYFRRYAKARASASAIPARIAALEAASLALREALVQIETAGTGDDLYEIHTDLVARRLLRRPPRTRPVTRSGPRRFDGPDGAVIVAGRSSRENDHVTFHVAGPDDLWFHARAIPGAHVVLKAPGTPSEAAVTAAAQIAAYYSEGRQAAQVAVDMVPRRQVRKARGAAPGAVIYEGERTLRVSPSLPASQP